LDLLEFEELALRRGGFLPRYLTESGETITIVIYEEIGALRRF